LKRYTHNGLSIYQTKYSRPHFSPHYAYATYCSIV